MITAAQLAALEGAAQAHEHRLELRCHVAMADIYATAGLLPPMEVAQGPRNWAAYSDKSLIAECVAECPHFVEVAAPSQPGDLLGFRLGHTLHHVAIQLAGGRMVHVFGYAGIRIAPCIPTEWAKRIEKVWRPVACLNGDQP